MEKEETEQKGQPMDLAKALSEEKKRAEDYLSRLKYLQADFENFRKRSEKEASDVEEAAVRGVAVRLLSVYEELGLAMGHPEGQKSELQEGVEMIRKKLGGILESTGVQKIDCVGSPFDPRYHEAVEKVQGKGERDLVVEEVRSGYTFRGQVIRPSMVKVQLGMKKEKQVDSE